MASVMPDAPVISGLKYGFYPSNYISLHVSLNDVSPASNTKLQFNLPYGKFPSEGKSEPSDTAKDKKYMSNIYVFYLSTNPTRLSYFERVKMIPV